MVSPSRATAGRQYPPTSVTLHKWPHQCQSEHFVHNPLRLKVGTVCIALGPTVGDGGRELLATFDVMLPDGVIVSLRTTYLNVAQTTSDEV